MLQYGAPWDDAHHLAQRNLLIHLALNLQASRTCAIPRTPSHSIGHCCKSEHWAHVVLLASLGFLFLNNPMLRRHKRFTISMKRA